MPENTGASLLGDPATQNPNPAAAAAAPATPAAAPGSNVNVNPGTDQQQSYDWISGLPDDLKAEASLKVIHGKDDKEVIQALAKSYVHSQRHMGADKIPVPTKHATEDDWKQIYKKLGLPDNPDLYEFDQLPPGVDVKSETFKAFKTKALEAGILPKQAQKILSWFHESAEQQRTKFVESQKQAFETTINTLKDEWGNAFDGKIAKVKSVLKEVGGDEFVKFMNESGFGNRMEVVRFAEKLAKRFEEDGTEAGNPNPAAGRLTPQEANQKINAIMTNKAHPANNPEHVGYQAAQAELTKLFADAHPR